MMRTITAPGVQWYETDKSDYSPTMTGTACFVPVFTDKGEPYVTKEFTSRSAWLNYYGEPETEAEKYGYAAICEVLNNNGKLYTARLPYANDVLNNFVGVKYEVYSTLTSDSVTCDVNLTEKYPEIIQKDSTICKAIAISTTGKPSLYSTTDINDYRNNERRVQDGSFIIIDTTCGNYKKVSEDNRKGIDRELIGIVPVVTTAANAIQAQYFITPTDETLSNYESVSGEVLYTIEDTNTGTCKELSSSDCANNFNTAIKNQTAYSGFNYNKSNGTMSLNANQFFTTIQHSDGKFDRDNLKDIGVVVFKLYLDPTSGNKVNYEVVESFCGSLNKDDVDATTKQTKFIDTIVNTNSQYINLFSNCFNNSGAKSHYNEADIMLMLPSPAADLGFFSSMTKKDISLQDSIFNGLNTTLDKIKDLNKLDIDIVCDAGIANIGSFVATLFTDGKGEYDLNQLSSTDSTIVLAKQWSCQSSSDSAVKYWKAIEQIFDTFCKNTRKDCMFIADGLRPLVLDGDKPKVRDTKPTSSIDVDILPNLPAICGLNTSYGAGYCNWFQIADEYSGNLFWCPPSIKAMGAYINTDINYNYWDAPAGMTRGIIAATDVSFSPTAAQAGGFYDKNWNYAINYPNDGIILEGQKTFQVKPTAFDRVNVRRLFLRLERQCAKVAKYFLYEGNTAYTRQRLVDAIDPYFASATAGGGIYDYKIICDETNNTAQTIDNSELHVSIGIKPTKTIEYIMLNFIAGSTGMSWEEIMG